MTAGEFAEAINHSKKFRERIDGPSSVVVPALADEKKRELQREIARMSSRQYDERCQSDPKFRQQAEELYK